MNIISIIISGLSIISGNVQFMIAVLSLTLFAYYYSYKSNSSCLAYFIAFIVAYPSAMNGMSFINNIDTIILVSSILFLILSLYSNQIPKVKLVFWEKFILCLIVVAAIIVYLPIFFETYLSIKISHGPEEEYVSNVRRSHMLSFVVPLLFAPFVTIATMRSFRNSTNFNTLYEFVKVLTWFIVVLSLVRFVLNVDFIPQEYQAVRPDGNRLSGILSPDSNYYGRSLLIPLAIIASYAFAKRNDYNAYTLITIIILSIVMTMSRTTIISSFIILFIIMFYNFRTSLILKAGMVFIVAISVMHFSGILGGLLSRTYGSEGLNLSGRHVIYMTALNVLQESPYVGLRPGGWVEWHEQGVKFLHLTMKTQSAHSFYLNTAVNWGVPITTFLVLVLLHSIYLMHLVTRCAKKLDNNEYSYLRIWAVSMLAVTLGLMIHGITESVPFHIFFFLLGISWSLYYIKKHYTIHAVK
jgi:hypothetical protein